MIDVSILTTGQSEGIRKRRFAVKNTLKDLIAAKGKVNTINYQKTWNDLKEHSDLVRYFDRHCTVLRFQQFQYS